MRNSVIRAAAMALKESYEGLVNERLSVVARVRGELSKELFNPYDFRQLQANLLSYVSSLKSLIMIIPRDLLGDQFLQLYRRAGGLELLIIRATDINQLLKHVETADEIFIDLINSLYRVGLITQGTGAKIG